MTTHWSWSSVHAHGRQRVFNYLDPRRYHVSVRGESRLDRLDLGIQQVHLLRDMIVNNSMCFGNEGLVGDEVVMNALRDRSVLLTSLVQMSDGLSLQSNEPFSGVEAIVDSLDNAFEVLQILHTVVRSL